MADPGLIWLDGFEVDRNLGCYSHKNDLSVTNDGRNGGYCLKANGGNQPYARLFLGNTYDRFYIGYAWYGDSESTIALREENNTYHLSFGIDGNGYAKLWRGQSGYWGGTLLATSTKYTQAGAVWKYVEVFARVHDTLGSFILKVNGEEFLNFSGDTRNGGTAGLINELFIGKQGWNTSGESWRLDDFYVADGNAGGANFLGDLSVEMLLLQADSSVQFTPSAGSNFQCLDEIPFSATDYVSSTNSSHKDEYVLNNSTKPATYVPLAVRVISMMDKTDGQTKKTRNIIKDGANYGNGSTRYLASGGQVIYSDVFGQRPSAGGDWTAATIDSLVVGIENVP